jgi:hypothetical protein
MVQSEFLILKEIGMQGLRVKGVRIKGMDEHSSHVNSIRGMVQSEFLVRN